MRDECGLYNPPYTSTAIKSVWLPISDWLFARITCCQKINCISLKGCVGLKVCLGVGRMTEVKDRG